MSNICTCRCNMTSLSQQEHKTYMAKLSGQSCKPNLVTGDCQQGSSRAPAEKRRRSAQLIRTDHKQLPLRQRHLWRTISLFQHWLGHARRNNVAVCQCDVPRARAVQPNGFLHSSGSIKWKHINLCHALHIVFDIFEALRVTHLAEACSAK